MTSKSVTDLKICILSEFFYPDSNSGTGKAITDIAHNLARDPRVKVDVICGARTYLNGAKMSARESFDGINIRRVSYPDWNRSGVTKRSLCNVVLALKAACRLLFSPKYDVILVTSAPPFMPMAAYIINKLRRTPYAYLVYDLEPDRACRLEAVDCSSLPAKMLSRAQGKWLRASARVVTIGRCMKNLIKEVYSVREEALEVVPVGVDQNSIRYASYPVISQSEPTRLRIVYSGNLGRYHDFDTLLDCAKQLPVSEYEFLIVGSGAKRPHVDERIEAEGIKNVTALSPLPFAEYEKLLHSADVCFVTMEKGIEGTCVPSKFYSILAAGRPTLAVASQASELAMSLQEHECGLVVEPANPDALLSALKKMRCCPEMLLRMAENARTAFLANYTTTITVGRINEILHSVAGVEQSLDSVNTSSNFSTPARMEDSTLLANAIGKSDRAKGR